jgi:hypothetical protein
MNNANWRLVDKTPLKAVWWLDMGNGQYIQKTEYFTEELIADNRRQQVDNLNEKFGDGKIVARVPMNIAFGNSYFSDALKNKDENAMSKWLNDKDNEAFRTFGGKV